MEEFETTKERPAFLTVICILSFIMIGLQILNGFSSIVMAPMLEETMDLQQEQMEEAMDTMEEEGMGGFGSLMETMMSSSESAVEHAKTLGIIGIIAALLCLFGVIKMWKMQKSGFVPYVVGELGAPIASLVLVGMMGGLSLLGLFFPILFVILYGVNLKHMS